MGIDESLMIQLNIAYRGFRIYHGVTSKHYLNLRSYFHKRYYKLALQY